MLMEILISGDSWGCGEWCWAENNPISHKGIEQYFVNNNYFVKNTSRPGGSNDISVHKIKNNLNKNYDAIVWFQTDPLRDNGHVILKKENLTYSDILNEQDRLLKNTYKKLNSFGVDILCIGGCSKINLELIQQYKNLKVVIPSVPELLINKYTHPDIWYGNEWTYNIKNNLDYDCVEKLYAAKVSIQAIEHNIEFFHPDGRHPNRKGHWEIYQALLKFILKN
jgi:hypothetical protein